MVTPGGLRETTGTGDLGRPAQRAWARLPHAGSMCSRRREHITYNSVHELACKGYHDVPEGREHRRGRTGTREVGGNRPWRVPRPRTRGRAIDRATGFHETLL